MEAVVQIPSSNGTVLPGLPQLHSPVSFKPALRQLQKQRRETAALRELWQSLSEKRHRRQLDLKIKPKLNFLRNTHVLPESTTCKDDKAPAVDAAVGELGNRSPGDDLAESREATDVGEAPAEAGPKQEGQQEQQLPVISKPTDTNILLQRPYQSAVMTQLQRSKTSQNRNTTSRRLQRGKAVTSSYNLRQDDVKSPVPYHTAITRRPERRSSPRFQALTHLPTSPLPHLMEGGVARSLTAQPAPRCLGLRRDIKEWQNEIVKVVPARPEFYQPLRNGVRTPKVMTFRYPYKVLNFDPACLFYRSYSKVVDKDYVINPEWSSEKHPGLGSRAHTDFCLRADGKRM